MRMGLFRAGLRLALVLNFIGVFAVATERPQGPCDDLLNKSAVSGPSAPREPSYDDVITSVPGEAEKLSFTVGGKGYEVEVRQQMELERRINLPSGGLEEISSVASRLLYEFYPEQHQTARLKTYGNAMTPDLWSGKVGLAPLFSRLEQFHDSRVSMPGGDTGGGSWGYQPPPRRRVGNWAIGDEKDRAAALVQELFGTRLNLKPVEGGGWSDYIEVQYLVGWQNETAIYYDTSDAFLAARGIAVRMKSWFPRNQALATEPTMPDEHSLSKAVRRALTIKFTRPDAGTFTQRHEVHVTLPPNLALKDVPELTRQLLSSRFALEGEKLAGLAPIRRIDTERIGLNLVERTAEQPVKIGFITVDRFVRTDLVGGHSQQSNPVRQIEIEILPEQAGRLQRDQELRSELESFLKALDASVQGTLTTKPKYLQ